jgi:hypothetical protein
MRRERERERVCLMVVGRRGRRDDRSGDKDNFQKPDKAL